MSKKKAGARNERANKNIKHLHGRATSKLKRANKKARKAQRKERRAQKVANKRKGAVNAAAAEGPQVMSGARELKLSSSTSYADMPACTAQEASAGDWIAHGGSAASFEAMDASRRQVGKDLPRTSSTMSDEESQGRACFRSV